MELALLLCLLHVLHPYSIALFAESKATTEVVENTFALVYPLGAPGTRCVLVVVCHVYFPFLFKVF